MIINYPTALYRSVLPVSDESGNVTYTISNQEPPKSLSIFLQLPRNEELRKQPQRTYSKADKRQFSSSLIFNLTIPSLSTEGSGSKTFEIGQFLDFTSETEEIPDPYSLESIELRQDTNVVDYKKFGLDEAEYTNIVQIASKRMDDISNEINTTGTRLNDNKENVSSNQSDINESTKLYDNIVLILGADSEQAKKVQSKIDGYNAYKVQLLAERDTLLATLDSLRSDLSKVREVVR
jgi:hypothetical protein